MVSSKSICLSGHTMDYVYGLCSLNRLVYSSFLACFINEYAVRGHCLLQLCNEFAYLHWMSLTASPCTVCIVAGTFDGAKYSWLSTGPRTFNLLWIIPLPAVKAATTKILTTNSLILLNHEYFDPRKLPAILRYMGIIRNRHSMRPSVLWNIQARARGRSPEGELSILHKTRGFLLL